MTVVGASSYQGMRQQDGQSRHALMAFCLIVGVGVIALYGATYLTTSQQQTQTLASHVQTAESLGLSNGQGAYSFGNTATNNGGWKMPADTLVSTSFVTTHAMSGFVSVTVYVIPYAITPTTQLHLGLYVNGALMSSNTVDVSKSRAPIASVVGQIASIPTGEVANFTKSLQGYQAFYPLSNSLPVGTTIGVVAYSNSPIWIQTAQTAVAHSYATSGISTLPKFVPTLSAATMVPDLCIGGESNEA